VGKNSPIILATSVVFKTIAQSKNHPMGEKSSNPVTLLRMVKFIACSLFVVSQKEETTLCSKEAAATLLSFPPKKFQKS
jgi:hypothetical protein